jgi:calcineurin-like phosphoesterase family protein
LIDRGLLLGDLSAEQVADDARRFVPALDAGRHHLVVGGAHTEELECRHQFEDFGSFHQKALRRLS